MSEVNGAVKIELLFSYGTLQQDDVQRETFGRLLEGVKDNISGYVVGEIRITDEAVLKASGKEFHPILRKTGNTEDKVSGTVYQITSEELAHADEYEVDDYVRVGVQSDLGQTVWIYAAKSSD